MWIQAPSVVYNLSDYFRTNSLVLFELAKSIRYLFDDNGPGCRSLRLRSLRMAWYLVPSHPRGAMHCFVGRGDIPLHNMKKWLIITVVQANIMNAYHIPPQYFASACSALLLDMVPEEFRDYSMCMTSSGNPETELGDVPEEHRTFAVIKQSGKLFDVPPEHLMRADATRKDGMSLYTVPVKPQVCDDALGAADRIFGRCLKAVTNTPPALTNVPAQILPQIIDAFLALTL